MVEMPVASHEIDAEAEALEASSAPDGPAGARGGSGYASLLRPESGVRIRGTSGRLGMVASVLALMVGCAALAVRGARRVRELASLTQQTRPLFLAAQSPSPSCAGDGQNCWDSRCCKDSSKQCYAKDTAWAVCKASCTPGIDPKEAPEVQTPWSCTPVATAPRCALVGQNCTMTGCCADKRMTCYFKDPGWAECKKSCRAGHIDPNEPLHLQRPWSCKAAGPGSQPPAPTTTAEPKSTQWPLPPSFLPKPHQRREVIGDGDGIVTVRSSMCAKMYGNCTGTGCCRDPNMKCYKRDPFWSECRESCPNDQNWGCSRTATLDGSSSVTAQSADRPSRTAANAPVVGEADAEKGSGSMKPWAGPSPSLYCFSLMLPFGYEVSLIRSQLAQGVGIFKCNEYAVISNSSVELSPGPPVRIVADVVEGSLKCDFGGEYHTALNSEIFYRIWKKVISTRRFSLYDWTVKMDPDAVFLPYRLRWHVQAHRPSESLYLNNCDEGLHGPIEAISHGGMEVYSKQIDRCRDALQGEWMTYGEDVWLRRCWAVLNIKRVDDFAILREKACRPYKDPIPCSSGAVSFHPLKTPEGYFKCLEQARGQDDPERDGDDDQAGA